ncbi:MAG: hypothetical protein ABW217_22795 [Polyangiaceae bacterium]
MRALLCITVSAALCGLASSCWVTREESPFGGRVCDDDCFESCGVSLWDDEQRVARNYQCTLRDDRQACVCDGIEAATQSSAVDCSEAITRACGVSTSYPGYCRNEGGMCWPRTNTADGAWLCRCDGSEAVLESDDPLCESALFATCPVSCESERGTCTSGEETYSYDCDCDVGAATLQEMDSCDWALSSACEPRCSGELGRCYERDDAYICSCGEEQQLVTTSRARSCGEAMVVACAGIAPDDCSRETENVHAECQLDGSGYSCLCSTTFPGGAGVGGIGDLGTWRETEEGWTIDLTCEAALQQACFE